MLEICMLGILVSIIKLKSLAQISYGMGLFCFVLLLTITLLASVTLDEHKYWVSIKDVKSFNRSVPPEAELSWKKIWTKGV